MKKVILTGATGLIGKEAVKPLIDNGFEIYPINSQNCNIFDENQIKIKFREVKPQYLLHFAGYTGEGYLTSEINYKFIDAGLNVLKYFKENNGKRAIFAGTCFEYDFKNTPLKEDDPLNPLTPYAQCKVELYRQASEYCIRNNLSFGWGRIFYVFGNDENEKRLTSYIKNNLLNNKPIEIQCGQLIRDYMYSADIARAFVKFLDTDVTGAVNICSGQGISLENYTLTIAKALNKENLVKIHKNITNQPEIIIGNNEKLLNLIKFEPSKNIKNKIKELFNVY